MDLVFPKRILLLKHQAAITQVSKTVSSSIFIVIGISSCSFPF